MRTYALYLLLALLCWNIACKKESLPPEDQNTSDKVLKIKFRFDPTQERLDNRGQPAQLPATHAGQNPMFNQLGVHFIELLRDDFTPYQRGTLVYQGEEIPADNPNDYGFITAIDFDRALRAGDGEVFLEVPIKDLAIGAYPHVRVSVAYQNYGIRFNLNNLPIVNSLSQQSGVLASFLGFNTYINQVQVADQSTTVADNKLQGFWAFESQLNAPYDNYNQIITGQAPADATTVVNPFPNIPIPEGSCVITGSFDQSLIISGQEEEDLEVTLSFSINKSFEWEDDNGNGQWDIDAQNPSATEAVIDMGLRGLKASY